MKKILLCISLLTGTGAYAQFGIGGQANWMKYGGGGESFIGLGVNGSYVVADDYPIRLSINFGLPKSTSTQTSAYALSSVTTPSSISVNYEEKISLLNIWLDVQKFFGKGDYEDGGFYGAVGFGYTSAKVKYSVDSYNETLYSAGTFEDQSVGQLSIRGMLGFDKGLDFANIFGEAGLNLSANSANDQEIQVNLPSFIFVSVGLRKWIN